MGKEGSEDAMAYSGGKRPYTKPVLAPGDLKAPRPIIDLGDGTSAVLLTRGQTSRILTVNRTMVESFSWFALWNDHTNSFYAAAETRVNGERLTLLMHRVIMGVGVAQGRMVQVDHRSHNTLDNRRHELRTVTAAQNRGNSRKRKSGASALKGVCWHNKTGKWMARVQVMGKTRYLGYYSSDVEAALAYDTAARSYFGEYAHTNFPPSAGSSPEEQ